MTAGMQGVGIDQSSSVADTSPQVRYLNYRNPLETWLDLAQSAVTPGTVFASSAVVALPRFTRFVVSMGEFLRDFGAERRTQQARARQEEARATMAQAHADIARAIADRVVIGLDDVDWISRLQRGDDSGPRCGDRGRL